METTLGASFARLEEGTPNNGTVELTCLNNSSAAAQTTTTTTQIKGMEALEELMALEADVMTAEELSFYSASGNDHGDDNIWGLLSGIGGNIYEWYDFAVYGLLAPEIGAAFFPDSSKKLQLINSFGVYLAAFLMRYVVLFQGSGGGGGLFFVLFFVFPYRGSIH